MTQLTTPLKSDAQTRPSGTLLPTVLFIALCVGACGQVAIVPAGGTEGDAADSATGGNLDTFGVDSAGGQDAIAADATNSDASDGDSGVAADAVVGGECLTDFDCVSQVQGTTPCLLPSCASGFCTKKQKDVDAVCQNPGEVLAACEQSVCDGAGLCAKTALKDGVNCAIGGCGQVCAAGQCVAAPEDAYDDGNPCTKDFCDQGSAVVHEKITSLDIACDDGDPCTAEGFCVEGKCAGKPLDCSDGIACTVDSCVGADGCKHTVNDKLCTDEDPCTTLGCDLLGDCVLKSPNTGASCDDGNPCTETDVCDDQAVCGGTPSCACTKDTDCKAENLCLGPVSCSAGVCVVDPAKAVVCDSKNDSTCQKSTCDSSTGVCAPVALAEGLECDDSDACTAESTCVAGACTMKTAQSCDDGKVCTTDTCDAKTGCQNAANSVSCDDGDACSDQDVCASGGCKGVAKACDDGIACTYESCEGGTCSHAPQHAQCDDKNPCTADSCVVGKGCQNVADDKAACDDGDACTVDACKSGTCNSTNTCPCQPATETKDCDDNNPCTVDTCDLAAKACKYNPAAANNKACDSGDK